MKEYTLNYNELTDSREILYAREPRFMVIFIFLTFVMILGLFIWSWFGEIEEVVKAQGRVLPCEDISIICSTSSGFIKGIHIKDGQQVNRGDLLLTIENKATLVEKSNCQIQLNKTNYENLMWSTFERAINENKNLFSPNETEFTYRFMAYKYNYDQLYAKYTKAQADYLREKPLYPDVISKERIDVLEANYRDLELSMNKLRSETLSKIKDELQNNQEELLLYQNTLSEADEKIKLSKVVAPIKGIVQIQRFINRAEYLSDGVEILKIIPSQDANYRLEISVENRNIGLIKVGQKIRYDFQTFPFQEYGFANGKITYISTDVAQNDSMVYRIQGSVVESVLRNRKGEVGKIKPGMICEVRIVVKKKKILQLILEKLNLMVT